MDAQAAIPGSGLANLLEVPSQLSTRPLDSNFVSSVLQDHPKLCWGLFHPSALCPGISLIPGPSISESPQRKSSWRFSAVLSMVVPSSESSESWTVFFLVASIAYWCIYTGVWCISFSIFFSVTLLMYYKIFCHILKWKLTFYIKLYNWTIF